MLETKRTTKCIDVYGLKPIFSRLQQLANACGSGCNADPFSVVLSTLVIPHKHTNADLGFGSELLDEWCLRVDDGWERKLTEKNDGAVLSGQSKDVHVNEWLDGLGEVQSKREFRVKLKDLHFSRLSINDGVVKEPLATERRTKDLISVIWDSKKTNRPIRYVVNIFGSLKYLALFHKAHPDVVVYNLIDICRDVNTGEKLLADGEYIHNTLQRVTEPDDWENEFPALSEYEFEPPQVIVDDLLIKGNIHVAAGRFEAFKTMALIELFSAILDQRPAFDHFTVRNRYPVLFLCADMSPELFDQYAAPFNLRKHGTDFRVKKANGGIPDITDPVLQTAVRGRILVLDTMLDFAKIQKAFESGEWITFMQDLRDLMTVHGCIAIVMTAHATKAGAKSNTIDPSEYLKDSVTFGGKIDVGYAFSKLEGTSQVFVERIKSRGFKKALSFTITVNNADGESNLDRGRFPVYLKPGEAGKKQDHVAKSGPKADPDWKSKIDLARSTRGSLQDKADAVNGKFGTNHDRSTISRWLKKQPSLNFDEDKQAEVPA